MNDFVWWKELLRFGIAGAILIAWMWREKMINVVLKRQAETLDEYVKMIVDMTSASTKALTEVQAYMRGRNGSGSGGTGTGGS